MSAPVLLCQGFQKAFIDTASPFFSVSASMRRSICEKILSHARFSGWTVIHSFLELRALIGANNTSMDGFSPRPLEAHFQQRGLSAFDTPGFAAKLDSLGHNPIFFMSLAGLPVIGATFLGGIARHLPMCLIGDAVADFAQFGVSEEQRITAIETLARATGCWTASSDLVGTGPDQFTRTPAIHDSRFV